MTFCWSALWIMIWDTSVWRHESWNRRKILPPKNVTHVAGTFCHPCLRAGPWDSWSGREDLNLRPPGPEFKDLSERE